MSFFSPYIEAPPHSVRIGKECQANELIPANSVNSLSYVLRFLASLMSYFSVLQVIEDKNYLLQPVLARRPTG
jgi:hypothetical protein